MLIIMPIRPLFTLEEGLKPKIGSALSANFSSILLMFLFPLQLQIIYKFSKSMVKLENYQVCRYSKYCTQYSKHQPSMPCSFNHRFITVYSNKIVFFFRNIALKTEVSRVIPLEKNLILPKILQTLFVSAIPKNAPQFLGRLSVSGL